MDSENLRRTFSSIGLTGMVAFAYPMSTWAFDFSPDNTPYLSDPSFLPRQGEVFLITTYDYTTREQDWQPAGGTINEHYSANANNYVQQAEYGVTSRLAVGATGSYTDTNGRYTYSSQPATEINTSRFDNPTFDLIYRAVGQLESPVSIYIEGLFVPGIVDNAPRAYGANLFVNREFGISTSQGQIGLTIQGELGTLYNDCYTSTDPISGSTSDVTGRWSYFFAARSQLRLTSHWALDSGFVYSRDLAYSVVPSVVTDTSFVAPEAIVAPYVDVAFDIVPRRLSLTFEYDHDFIGDDRRGGATDGTWINQSQNYYAVHLFLLF